MSLDDLRPENSKKARESSVSSFKRFLKDEEVDLRDVDLCIRADATGSTIVALMDRFGVYLAHQKTRDGKGLRRNTVGQYFRQTKLWLYERYPQFASLVDGEILRRGKVLEKFSGMQPGGRMVKQAKACSKQDLYLLMRHLYSTATTTSDYQDSALLALLWYLFGRASDVSLLEKENLSVCAGNILFLRFLRMKTSEEQGLTLFPDSSVVTCPITALATALTTQTTPSSALLPHLPQPNACDIGLHGPLVPLSAVLAGATAGRSLLDETTEGNGAGEPEAMKQRQTSKPKSSTPGIHAYINRVLSRIVQPAGVVSTLSSHSFRRGGAQHCNGKAGLSMHWIADRGGWNMTTTNKVFSYIFNTTEEDQKIAKTLSGFATNADVRVCSLADFDSCTRARLDKLKGDLFSSCSGLQQENLNVSAEVLDVLCAYLVKGYPQLKAMNPSSPLVARMELAMSRVGVEMDQLIAWSVHLINCSKITTTTNESSSKHLEVIEHQAAVIDQLIDLSSTLSERLRKIEATLGQETSKENEEPPRKRQHKESETKPVKRRKKSTNLAEAWFEWYDGRAHTFEKDKHWKSELRRCVGFLLLFVESMDFDDQLPTFRDDLLAAGELASKKALEFLAQRSIKVTATGTALKAFRRLHAAGELDQLIADYHLRVKMGIVKDMAPRSQRTDLRPTKVATSQATLE